MKLKTAIATAAATAALLVGLAPTATATPTQDQALADIMADAGIYLYPVAYIQAGAVCVDVWNGYSPDWLASTIWSQNPDWTYLQAQTFVAASIAVYCPPSGPTHAV